MPSVFHTARGDAHKIVSQEEVQQDTIMELLDELMPVFPDRDLLDEIPASLWDEEETALEEAEAEACFQDFEFPSNSTISAFGNIDDDALSLQACWNK